MSSLADPTVARPFSPGSFTGKYVLQGIGAGAGISQFSKKKMVQEYGLAQHGWKFRTGAQQDCFEGAEHRIANEGGFRSHM